MLLGLGDVALPGAISQSGGINWNEWLQSGIAIGQTVLTATGQTIPTGHQTLTPNVVVPVTPAPASPSGVWAWLRTYWYVPAGAVLLAIAAKGRRR